MNLHDMLVSSARMCKRLEMMSNYYVLFSITMNEGFFRKGIEVSMLNDLVYMLDLLDKEIATMGYSEEFIAGIKHVYDMIDNLVVEVEEEMYREYKEREWQGGEPDEVQVDGRKNL